MQLEGHIEFVGFMFHYFIPQSKQKINRNFAQSTHSSSNNLVLNTLYWGVFEFN